MSRDGQGTKSRRNIAENFNRLSRVHERHRQTTDGRAIAYSEREREFTTKTYSENPVRVQVHESSCDGEKELVS